MENAPLDQSPSDFVYADYEGVTRLPSRVLAGERFAVVAGTTIERGPQGGVLLRAGAIESEIDGLAVAEVAKILAAVDGQAVVAEVQHRLAPEFDAATVEAVLSGLAGGVLQLCHPAAARRETRSLLVIDDFLEDAEARRAEALQSEYRPISWFLFPGVFSVATPKNIQAVMDRIAAILGTELLWGEGPVHGRYRYSSTEHVRRAGANVHVDPFTWNAVISLTPTALCTGGISFYRHRASGLFGRDAGSLRAAGMAEPEFGRYVKKLVQEDGPQVHHWDEVSRIDLRMNRLILFNPRLFHRTNSQFGSSVQDGRLTQGFSCFAVDDPYRFEPWA